MKNKGNHIHLVFFVFTFGLIITIQSCSQQNSIKPSSETLDYYTHVNEFTDPGEYLYLYDDLPESYAKICSLIKKLLIHPMEASNLQDVLPEGRYIEDGEFLSVEKMLHGLMGRDSNGLMMNRRPEDRLVVACYHHGLMLTSILRSKGIPVRMRAGFARYFEKKAKVRFGHVICEIWNEEESRWIWIDPDREFVDMRKDQFELPLYAWQNLRMDRLPKVKYTAALMEGEQAILHILLLDHLFVMADDQLYWHQPSLLYTRNFSLDNLKERELLIFDQIAKLLEEPDMSLAQLQEIYKDNIFLQPLKYSFEDFYEKMTGESIENIAN